MLAEKLTLLLAAAGQASAAFTIGHLASNSYVDTEFTSLKHDNSASQGKLTLGDLTYTYLSSEFTAQSATDTLAEAMPQSTSSSPTTSITTETATETRHLTRTTTITRTRTRMINTTSPAATHTHPVLGAGDLPFHIHGGGDYTSITFYGYGTPTPSTTHSTVTTVKSYANSIETTQPLISTVATTTALPVSTASTTSIVSPSTPTAISTTVTTSTSLSTTHLTTASPNDMPSTSLPNAADTRSATTLSGLTVPQESATATEPPKAAGTHDLSAGSRAELALAPMLLSMALVVLFVLQ